MRKITTQAVSLILALFIALTGTALAQTTGGATSTTGSTTGTTSGTTTSGSATGTGSSTGTGGATYSGTTSSTTPTGGVRAGFGGTDVANKTVIALLVFVTGASGLLLFRKIQYKE